MDYGMMLSKLSGGMLTTIAIFGLTLLFSMPLGMIVAFGRMSKNAVIRNLTKIYISVMRGTPLMLQIMVVYFGRYYLFGVRITSSYRFIAVIIAFALNYAAYFAEIYRGGIESMPAGQYEAANLLDIRKARRFSGLYFRRWSKESSLRSQMKLLRWSRILLWRWRLRYLRCLR